MTHLARLGTLLLLGLAGFLFVRFGTTQASVSLIGLVRGNNAVHWASLNPRLGNPNECASCHADVDLEWSRSAHSGQACESCHGAGDRHIAYGAVMGPMKELCTTCHQKIPGRPASMPQVSLIEHYPQQDCMNCHDPHAPAAAFPKIPHSVIGRQDCLACHGVKDIAPLPPNHANRPVELCLGCHKPGDQVAALEGP